MFIVVRKDVVLGYQECPELMSQFSTTLKCIDVTGPNPCVPYEGRRGSRWRHSVRRCRVTVELRVGGDPLSPVTWRGRDLAVEVMWRFGCIH